MRQHICTLCALLLLTASAYAAETLDEKVYDAGQQPPVIGTPSPNGPDIIVVPGGPSAPSGPSGPPAPSGQSPDSSTIIVVPTTPGQQMPGVAPGQSVPESMQPESVQPSTVQPSTVQPDALQKESPTLVVPPVPAIPTVPAIPIGPVAPAMPAIPVIPAIPTVPEIPKTPGTEKRDIIITPIQPAQTVQPGQTRQPVRPGDRKEGLTPKTEERVILTPADFLPLTPNKAETKDATLEPSKASPKPKINPSKDKQTPEKAQTEAKPEAKPEAPKDSKDPKDSKAQKDPKESKDSKDSTDKKDPKKAKPTPEKKKPAREAKKGDIMRIPPDAAKTGDLSFLEGCWKGMVSGADGRIHRDNMTSRVCFDDKGKGQNSLHDPGRKETCMGPATGIVSGDNLMRVDYDKVQCPSGKTWYPQGDGYMTCSDAGTGANCFVYFEGEPKLKFRFYKD